MRRPRLCSPPAMAGTRAAVRAPPRSPNPRRHAATCPCLTRGHADEPRRGEVRLHSVKCAGRTPVHGRPSLHLARALGPPGTAARRGVAAQQARHRAALARVQQQQPLRCTRFWGHGVAAPCASARSGQPRRRRRHHRQVSQALDYVPRARDRRRRHRRRRQQRLQRRPPRARARGRALDALAMPAAALGGRRLRAGQRAITGSAVRGARKWQRALLRKRAWRPGGRVGLARGSRPCMRRPRAAVAGNDDRTGARACRCARVHNQRDFGNAGRGRCSARRAGLGARGCGNHAGHARCPDVHALGGALLNARASGAQRALARALLTKHARSRHALDGTLAAVRCATVSRALDRAPRGVRRCDV